MHWKLKATIQNAISMLPSSNSYEVYYWIQRHFGGLRRINPTKRLTAGAKTWRQIQQSGHNPLDKVFLEIGTGRIPLVPLAYWLMGAEKTISLDLNPYLKEELIRESVFYISENNDEILEIFGDSIDRKRFHELLSFSRNPAFNVSEFLDLCRIEYIAPGDAAATGLPDQSIDFHTSYTVFEHIPPTVLKQILKEGNRIIKNNGLFVHRIDYSDHFSHSDRSISAINFLQYSNDEWKKYANNRYMYMNRLRHDDFINLFESAGHNIVETQLNIDQGLQDLLKNGNLGLNEEFSSKSEEVLAITGAWMLSRTNNSSNTAGT